MAARKVFRTDRDERRWATEWLGDITVVDLHNRGKRQLDWTLRGGKRQGTEYDLDTASASRAPLALWVAEYTGRSPTSFRTPA